MNLDTLSQTVQQGGYVEMQAGNFRLSDVFRYGESAAKRINLTPSNDPSKDLFGLVQRSGGRIHYVDFAYFRQYQGAPQPVWENSIYVHDDRDFDIILPTYDQYVEQRYTVAHELGHYVLHANGKCFARRRGNTRIEHEATYFALGFLMPSEYFDAAYTNVNGGIVELSLRFLVSAGAVLARTEIMKQMCEEKRIK